MFNFRQKEEQSFTLIELLVVIAIIAILAAVVLVSLDSARQQASESRGMHFAQNIKSTNSTDLVGEWSFDSTDIQGATAIDASGNGNNGTINGATPTTGKVREALNFNSANSDYVLINNPIRFTQGDYTIDGWFRTTGSGSAGVDILAATNPSDNYHGILIEITSTGAFRYLQRFPSASGGGTNLYSNKTYNDGKYHHFATTKTGSTMKLYIDGIFINTIDITSGDTVLNTALDIVLGKLGKAYSSRYFPGAIDEVRIYKAALTSKEIQQHYAESVLTHLAEK